MTALELCAPQPAEHRTHLVVGWAATDLNAHMRSTAYLDAVIDSRIRYLQCNGWPLERLRQERIGPILLSDEIVYHHELRHADVAVIDIALAGLSPDGARFRLRSSVRRENDGVVAATVTSDAAFMHLEQRRLLVPPAELRDVLAVLPRTPDFEVLRPLDGDRAAG